MRTTVSLPDDLCARADRLAKRMGRSRSDLYRDALESYLAAHDEDEVTAAMDRVVDAVDPAMDPFAAEAVRRAFERSEL